MYNVTFPPKKGQRKKKEEVKVEEAEAEAKAETEEVRDGLVDILFIAFILLLFHILNQLYFSLVYR
jgi:hypothetical protein